jgi:hypothetical protein
MLRRAGVEDPRWPPWLSSAHDRRGDGVEQRELQKGGYREQVQPDDERDQAELSS